MHMHNRGILVTVFSSMHRAIMLATEGMGWRRPFAIVAWWIAIGWKAPFLIAYEIDARIEDDQRYNG